MLSTIQSLENNGEEIEPEDITYSDITNWIFGDNSDWEFKAQDYIETFQCADELKNLCVKNPRKKFFVINKYEDIRAYKKESNRLKEFPCKVHCFYAKFSKYDIRRVRSLQIQLNFSLTGNKRDFIYSFDEFLDFYSQDEGLCEDALVESMKHFYSDSGNLSSYFRILTLDTSECSRQKHQSNLSVQ